VEAVVTALEPNKAFATFSKDQVQSITFDYLTEAFPFWILGHARPRLRATSFRRIVWNWWALKSLEITRDHIAEHGVRLKAENTTNVDHFQQ
jgi:hypothetical protein